MGLGGITLAGWVTAIGGAAMMLLVIVPALRGGLRKVQPRRVMKGLVPALRGGLRKVQPRRVMKGLVPALRGGFWKNKLRRFVGSIVGGVAVLAAANFLVNYMYGQAILHVSVSMFWAGETAGLLAGGALPEIIKAFPEVKRGPLAFMRGHLMWPALALLGVLVLVHPWDGKFDLVGVVFSFFSGAGMAVRLIYTDKIPSEQRIFARGLSGVIGGLGLVALGSATEANDVGSNMSAWFIGALVLTGVLNVAFPGAAEVIATKTIKNVTTTSVIMTATPVFALIIACANEWRIPNLFELIGISVVVVAAYAAAKSKGLVSAAEAAMKAAGDVIANESGPRKGPYKGKRRVSRRGFLPKKKKRLPGRR
jgi:hypothetical protein